MRGGPGTRVVVRAPIVVLKRVHATGSADHWGLGSGIATRRVAGSRSGTCNLVDRTCSRCRSTAGSRSGVSGSPGTACAGLGDRCRAKVLRLWGSG